MKKIFRDYDQHGVKTIGIDDKLFNVRRGVVDNPSGEVTKLTIDPFMQRLFDASLLQNCPERIYAINRLGQPISINIVYEKGVPRSFTSEHWRKSPTVDAALKYIHAEHKDDKGLIIANPAVDLDDESADNVENLSDNPYPELKKFKREVYDGSLSPDLEQFAGKRFGFALGYPYIVNYHHKNKKIHTCTLANVEPAPEDVRFINRCLFEIAQVRHEGFEENDRFAFVDALTQDEIRIVFQQVFRVDLRYRDYRNDLEGLLN